MQVLRVCHSRTISIHALRGEGDVYSQRQKPARGISIHALRGEGDKYVENFAAMRDRISIHALRGEGDSAGIDLFL